MSGRFPRIDSSAYKICKLICRLNAITIEQGIDNHGRFGKASGDTLQTYNKCVEMSYLCEIQGVYTLMPHVRDWLNLANPEPAKNTERVLPMYRRPFSEMQPVERDPRLRDFHPVTVS